MLLYCHAISIDYMNNRQNTGIGNLFLAKMEIYHSTWFCCFPKLAKL